MMEYVLVLVAIVSIFAAVLRPQMKWLQQTLTEQFTTGIFNTDDTGSGFYRFRVR